MIFFFLSLLIKAIDEEVKFKTSKLPLFQGMTDLKKEEPKENKIEESKNIENKTIKSEKVKEEKQVNLVENKENIKLIGNNNNILKQGKTLKEIEELEHKKRIEQEKLKEKKQIKEEQEEIYKINYDSNLVNFVENLNIIKTDNKIIMLIESINEDGLDKMYGNSSKIYELKTKEYDKIKNIESITISKKEKKYVIQNMLNSEEINTKEGREVYFNKDEFSLNLSK